MTNLICQYKPDIFMIIVMATMYKVENNSMSGIDKNLKFVIRCQYSVMEKWLGKKH